MLLPSTRSSAGAAAHCALQTGIIPSGIARGLQFLFGGDAGLQHCITDPASRVASPIGPQDRPGEMVRMLQPRSGVTTSHLGDRRFFRLKRLCRAERALDMSLEHRPISYGCRLAHGRELSLPLDLEVAQS
jgi:hypothetical protein